MRDFLGLCMGLSVIVTVALITFAILTALFR